MTASSRRPYDWRVVAFETVLPLFAVLLALVVGAVLLLTLGKDPLVAYGAMLQGAVGSRSGITQTLTKATPLLLIALGITIAFRANTINIGGEGQLIVGALAATAFAVSLSAVPAFLLLPLTSWSGRWQERPGASFLASSRRV